MRITLNLDEHATPIFSRMAKEAHIATDDLAEIAVYNLIALYLKDKGVEVAPDIFAAESDPSPEPFNTSV